MALVLPAEIIHIRNGAMASKTEDPIEQVMGLVEEYLINVSVKTCSLDFLDELCDLHSKLAML